MLSKENAVLSAQSIAPHLHTNMFTIEVHDSVTSTTALLRQLAQQGQEEGHVIIAHEQTEGKGRLGRSFHSPAGGGIYMSILLRPTFLAIEAGALTACMAVLVSRAIEKHTGVTCEIKWVNDIFCHKKKVCGIGTEASLDVETNTLTYVILGVGINVHPSASEVPAELEDIVGTVLPQAPHDKDIKSLIVADILNELEKAYPNLNDNAFYEEYKSRCFILNQPIDIIQHNKKTSATALDILPDFSLKVALADGSIQTLTTGEVSVRLKENETL